MDDTMRERWILETKKGDFDGLARQLGVPPLVVRCMINRGVTGEADMKSYLQGTPADLYDPSQMKDLDKAVHILMQGKKQRKKAAIASDFDCDGIFSGYLLWRAFERIGLDSRIFTPDRVQEGYGLNERIVDEALAEDRSILITCDNGIAANAQVAYAKERGMTVIITDHHEVQETLPPADVIVDPKQEGETYPFDGLCGAGVAYKLICALYDACGIPEQEKEELISYVAIATVADVMELIDENRILVREGLRRLPDTDNPGLQALLKVQGMENREISAGHIGFVIGPCFNAAGRIATVQDSFDLLMERDPERALERAGHLRQINEERKQMTEEGAEQAYQMVEERGQDLPDVLVLLLPDTHESLAGIIAGRVKERYHHPDRRGACKRIRALGRGVPYVSGTDEM